MKKFYLYITSDEKNLIVQNLLEKKNNLIRQSKYTDAIDEILLKFLKCMQKKVRVNSILKH